MTRRATTKSQHVDGTILSLSPSATNTLPLQYAPARLVKKNTTPAIASIVPVRSAGIFDLGNSPLPIKPTDTSDGYTVTSSAHKVQISTRHNTLWLKKPKHTSRSNHIRPNTIRHQLRRQLLHQRRRPRLTLPIRITTRHIPVETRNTTGRYNLTLLLHITLPILRIMIRPCEW